MFRLANIANQHITDALINRPDVWGRLVTPSLKSRAGQLRDVQITNVWAADNNRFNAHYSDADFIRMLCDFQPWRSKCVFVLAPDVVGDAAATLTEFPFWYPAITGYGYPVGLAAQDGMTPDDVPWPQIAALFIGGSTEWKMSPDADRLIVDAKRREKWVHIGRVNSRKRANHFHLIGADSIDGTNEIYEPGVVHTWTGWLSQFHPAMGGFLCT